MSFPYSVDIRVGDNRKIKIKNTTSKQNKTTKYKDQQETIAVNRHLFRLRRISQTLKLKGKLKCPTLTGVRYFRGQRKRGRDYSYRSLL